MTNDVTSTETFDWTENLMRIWMMSSKSLIHMAKVRD